ncbi:hypothetical protein FACS189461_0720 [Spirochaetia bacterium]|nr:hypothetical protein FACS189461_0720 [Spirochaetia bacterium]
MKRFIREITRYFVIVLFICVLMTGIAYSITSSAKFVIPENKTMIFVGDSHTECAVNDNIFTQAFNISQSGTAYMYSYIKLKKFLETNNNIKKVMVSFQGGSIQKSLDEWTIGEKYIVAHGTNYISLMSINEFKVLMKNKAFFSALLKVPVRSVKAILKYVLNHHITYNDLNIGGYLWLDRDKLQAAVENQNEISENPMEYLEEHYQE